MKYCSEYVSRKIAVLSTVATIAVVVIHSNSLEDVRNPSWAFWVGRWISSLQHWAVPFFFMVSGFFFDRFFDGKPMLASLGGFLKRKFRSLAVPYVLWGGVFGFLTMTPLKMLVNRQHGDAILSGTIFSANGIFETIDRVVGLTGGNFVGALWYVRLLLIVFLTAPLWLCARRASKWLVVVVGVLLILCFSAVAGGGGDPDGERIGRFCIEFGGIGWLLLGMAASAFKVEEVRITKISVIASGLIWLAMMFLVIQSRFAEAPLNCWLKEWFRLSPLFLVIVWWGGYDIIPRILPEKLPDWFKVRFWVYCMHHPVTAWVGAAVHAVFGHAMCGRIAFQLLVAPLTIAACFASALIIRMSMPRLFAVMNGGR